MILQNVESDIVRIKNTIGFAKKMWGNGEELSRKLYLDLLKVNIGRFGEYWNNGKYPEVSLYIEAIDRNGKESGIDTEFMGRVVKEMKERIPDER